MGTDLDTTLSAFDGKHLEPLRGYVDEFDPDKALIHRLISIVENEDEVGQIGASWILLNGTRCHGLLDTDHKERILELLEPKMHWLVVLHILQMVPLIAFSNEESSEYLEAARYFSDHKRPFIKTVALHAMAILATEHESEHAEVYRQLKLGLDDRKASVRARMRHVFKDVAWVREFS